MGTSAITLASDSERVFGRGQASGLAEEYAGENVKDGTDSLETNSEEKTAESLKRLGPPPSGAS